MYEETIQHLNLYYQHKSAYEHHRLRRLRKQQAPQCLFCHQDGGMTFDVQSPQSTTTQYQARCKATVVPCAFAMDITIVMQNETKLRLECHERLNSIKQEIIHLKDDVLFKLQTEEEAKQKYTMLKEEMEQLTQQCLQWEEQPDVVTPTIAKVRHVQEDMRGLMREWSSLSYSHQLRLINQVVQMYIREVLPHLTPPPVECPDKWVMMDGTTSTVHIPKTHNQEMQDKPLDETDATTTTISTPTTSTDSLPPEQPPTPSFHLSWSISQNGGSTATTTPDKPQDDNTTFSGETSSFLLHLGQWKPREKTALRKSTVRLSSEFEITILDEKADKQEAMHYDVPSPGVVLRNAVRLFPKQIVWSEERIDLPTLVHRCILAAAVNTTPDAMVSLCIAVVECIMEDAYATEEHLQQWLMTGLAVQEGLYPLSNAALQKLLESGTALAMTQCSFLSARKHAVVPVGVQTCVEMEHPDWISAMMVRLGVSSVAQTRAQWWAHDQLHYHTRLKGTRVEVVDAHVLVDEACIMLVDDPQDVETVRHHLRSWHHYNPRRHVEPPATLPDLVVAAQKRWWKWQSMNLDQVVEDTKRHRQSALQWKPTISAPILSFLIGAQNDTFCFHPFALFAMGIDHHQPWSHLAAFRDAFIDQPIELESVYFQVRGTLVYHRKQGWLLNGKPWSMWHAQLTVDQCRDDGSGTMTVDGWLHYATHFTKENMVVANWKDILQTTLTQMPMLAVARIRSCLMPMPLHETVVIPVPALQHPMDIFIFRFCLLCCHCMPGVLQLTPRGFRVKQVLLWNAVRQLVVDLFEHHTLPVNILTLWKQTWNRLEQKREVTKTTAIQGAKESTIDYEHRIRMQDTDTVPPFAHDVEEALFRFVEQTLFQHHLQGCIVPQVDILRVVYWAIEQEQSPNYVVVLDFTNKAIIHSSLLHRVKTQLKSLSINLCVEPDDNFITQLLLEHAPHTLCFCIMHHHTVSPVVEAYLAHCHHFVLADPGDPNIPSSLRARTVPFPIDDGQSLANIGHALALSREWKWIAIAMEEETTTSINPKKLPKRKSQHERYEEAIQAVKEQLLDELFQLPATWKNKHIAVLVPSTVQKEYIQRMMKQRKLQLPHLTIYVLQETPIPPSTKAPIDLLIRGFYAMPFAQRFAWVQAAQTIWTLHAGIMSEWWYGQTGMFHWPEECK